MMQAANRHVLIFDKPPAVKRVLEELLAGVEPDGSIRSEIRRGLEEFAKHGGVRLILDTQVMEPSLEGRPATIRNLSAYLAGEVLIVTGQVASHWMLRILQAGAESRRHFFPERLISSMGVFISNLAVELGTAVQRVASPIWRAKANVGRARVR